MAKEKPLSEEAVMVLLRQRFPAPEFAFIPHVRNGTGTSRRITRTADALAMGLWPSRGLDLHGFEIKSDRHDWLNEKANPEKGDEIAARCDRWWLVVGAEEIVQPGELPPLWGLLVPRGGKLVAKVEPQRLEAKPMDRPQLAAILRRAAECVVPKMQIQAQLDAAHQVGWRAGAEEAKRHAANAAKDHERLVERIKAFEAASGVHLDSWHGGTAIGEAVRLVLDGGHEGMERRLRSLRETAANVLADVDARLAGLGGTTERKAG